jgi:hypothetical protein
LVPLASPPRLSFDGLGEKRFKDKSKETQIVVAQQFKKGVATSKSPQHSTKSTCELGLIEQRGYFEAFFLF